jgi:hypothetical protein
VVPHLAKNERDVGHPGFVGQKNGYQVFCIESAPGNIWLSGV